MDRGVRSGEPDQTDGVLPGLGTDELRRLREDLHASSLEESTTPAPPEARPPNGGASRPRSLRRWLRRFASDVLVLAGILMFLDVGLTVVWQEPLSSIYASKSQDALSDRLERVERLEAEREARARVRDERLREQRSLVRTERVARQRAERRKRQRAVALNRAETGDPLGRVEAEAIDVDFAFSQGTGDEQLREGPAHYQETSLPGQGGTVGIAGHRTTYSAPFREVDELEKGDEITVSMPYGRFTYAVESTRIVPPDALEVLQDAGGERLVLTACHPLYSAAQRIVVFARLEKSEAAAATEFVEDDGPARKANYRPGGGPTGIALGFVVLGLVAGAMGSLASLAALAGAAPPPRGNYALTLVGSLAAVALLVLVLLGTIG